MDDSSDVDNSLTDLHHGLDSSFDEPPRGLNKQEIPHARVSASMEAPSGVGVTEDQMSMLQDMVLEMKEGFKNALKELAKIQDKEEGETYHSRKLQQQQQRQLESLTETIHEIKDQLSSLNKSVKQIKDEQKTIKDHIEEVRTNRGSSQERKTHVERDRLALINDFTNAEEWKTKVPGLLPTEFDDHQDSSRLTYDTDDNEVTVTACKSLILTQALSDKCLKMNICYSSGDEDDEEFENHRTSYHTHTTAGVVSGRMDNRRHSMPSSATSQARAKDVGIAAQRQKAVKDLADLQREYCSQLWSLLHTYLTPLQTAGFLNARELGTLFPPYLDQLYAEHHHVCTGLQDRLANWTYMGTVADLLSRITDSHNSESVLSLYKEYVDDLLSAVTCLRRVQAQSSKFRSFLKAVKHISRPREDLMSLLLAPVQHMPKYLIQLQQVFRHTPASHPDFSILQSSLCRLQSFVNQMNEELSGTTEVLNQDRHPWSSGNSGQMLSPRDSGVHSNSTEDDNVMPSKSFSKAKRSYVPSEWLEDPGYGVHHRKVDDIIRQRYMRPSFSRLSALSQPDLTVYNSLNSHSSDHTFAQLPRSYSSIPTGVVDSGDEASRERQYRKFKIKRRNQSPVDYSTSPKGHLHRSLSPQVRPSSAIDFLSASHHHQQYQHPNNYRDLPVQFRKLLYQERPPRSSSLLAPHAADLSHKPIICRKHARRSQPLIPASTNYWPDTTISSTLPFRVGHQRMPLSARDLLPKRPPHYTTTDVLDGDDEQDEDDTKASDTHSLSTNGSHPYSSGQGSSNSHDIELELYHGHSSQTLKQGQQLSYSPGFSSAEVTASLARKLCDAQQGSEISHEGLLLKHNSSEVSEAKSSQMSAEQSQSTSNQVNSSGIVKKYFLTSNSGGDHDTFVSHTKSKLEESDEEGSQNTAVFPKKTLNSNECSATSFSQKQEEDDSFSSRSRSKVVSHFALPVNGGSKEGSDEIGNRQFVLKPSSRSQRDDRLDPDSIYSITSNRDPLTGNWAPPLGRRNQLQLISDTSDNVGQRMDRPEAHPLSQCSTNGSSCVNGSLSLNGSPDAAATQSSHPSYRQPQVFPHLVGSRDCDRISSEINTSAQKSKPFRSLSNGNPQSSPSTSSHETSNLANMNFSSLDSHKFNGKQSPLLSVLTRNGDRETAQTDLATTDIFQVNGVARQLSSQSDLLSYPDIHELPPLEVNDSASDVNNLGRKGDFRKKIKDTGKFNSCDGLPKSIDDPVNARKKMHFKSSIKNLFSKKKGQVILADVEREVVRQMSAAAAEGTGQSKSKAFLRKTKVGNLQDCQTQQCTLSKPIFESKTVTGKSDSNPTLKATKKFYFDTKQTRSPNGEHDRELSFHERGQQQINVLHCLNGHNKRHGIVVDTNDGPYGLTQDAGKDSARSTRQDNGSQPHPNGDCHSQSKSASTLYQTSSQQPPQSDSKWETEFSGSHKSTILLNKNKTPRHYQSQAVQKEQAALTHSHANKTLHMIEADCMKSTPDVDHNKILHKNRNEIIEHGDISKARFKTEKHYGPSHADSSTRLLNFSSHDLCQHCQKCELKQRDKVVPGCKGTVSLNSLKNVGPDLEKRSKVGHEGSRAQVIKTDGTSDISSSSSAPVNQNEGNRPLAEAAIQFPLTVKSSSLSLTDCLKAPKLISDKGKTTEVKSSGTFTEWMPDQLGDRCTHCSTSPIQSQTPPAKFQQQRQSSIATHNMPDVTRISKGTACSDQTGTHNYLCSEKSCLENVADLVSPADAYCGDTKMLVRADVEFCNNMNRNSSSELNSSLSDNCDGKMSTSPSDTSLSPQKVVVTSPGSCLLPQGETSESRSRVQRAPNELSRSRSTNLPKSFPGKQGSESFIMEETQTGVIVKRFSLQGKEFCEYKYYGDDTGGHTNIKRSENPKSLKALSASSVIAENFKHEPRGTHFGYDRNRQASDQPAIYLTLSSPSDDYPENRQHASDQTASDSISGSILTGPRFYLNSPTGHNKPFYSNLLSTSCEQPSSDIQADVPQKDYDNTNPNAGAYSVHEISSNLRAPPRPADQGLQEEEICLKRVQTNKDLDRDKNTSSAPRLHATPSSSTALLSDESSSYKPKNPIPVTNLPLSDTMDFLGSQPIKCYTSNGDHDPNVLLGDARKRQRPSSSHETSSSSLNLPLRMTVSYSHDPHRPLTSNHRPRAKDDIQCSESCSRQQTGSGSVYKRSHGFLRTNSPSDFFSIRPYVDYTASKASSDSGIPLHSDQIRSSTPKGRMFYKGSSSEKLNKDKKHVSSRKTRSSSEKSNKRCKSPIKCVENVNNLDEVENCQSSYSSRSRHSDGAKFSSQECYQAQYPRYSTDSSSLISNAFLQKMAHLPKHTARPVSHPHVDDSHLSHSFTRHVSTNEDFSRNSQCLNGAESTVLASAHSSRSFRITTSAVKNLPPAHSSDAKNLLPAHSSDAKNLPPAHSSDAKNEEAPHMNHEKQKRRRSCAKAETTIIQASPDLILLNDGMKEEAAAKEKSPLSRKAQSFFSKLTHSPISLFHRDSKSPNPPK